MSDSDDLRRLYRQLPEEEPSLELDARVRMAVMAALGQAGQTDDHRAGSRNWQRWQRWQVPLATAATVVMAVALLLQQAPPRSTKPTTVAAPTDTLMGITAEAVSPLVRLPEAAVSAKRLAASPPPAPPPVELPAVVPPPAAIVALSAPASAPTPAAAIPPTAMDRSSDGLAWLSTDAVGLTAAAFCARLSPLWPAGETAPDCPATDGTHEWPAPVAVRWEVANGAVRHAEPLLP